MPYRISGIVLHLKQAIETMDIGLEETWNAL